MTTADGKPASRTAAMVAAALIALLAVGLVADLVNLPSRYSFLRPVRTGDSLARAADAVGRNRMLSVMVGLAAREAAGGRVDDLSVPLDLASVNIAEKGAGAASDVFGGVAQPALDVRLFGPLVRERIHAVDYEPVLGAGLIQGFKERHVLRAYPRGVFAVTQASAVTSSKGVVVLMTDAAREHLYLVPRSLVGEL